MIDRLRRLRWGKAFVAGMLAVMIALPLCAFSQETLETIPVKKPQMLRVLLSRLNIADRLDMKLDGVYAVHNSITGSMIFKAGSELTIIRRGEELYLYYMGMAWNAGKYLTFTRYMAEENRENGLRLMDNANLYEGDLALTATGENIRAILTIHLEDYLLGVVPYEMSNSFPLEALKAQAIAARTYAAKKMGAKGDYDLVDTTNDQVFRGKSASSDKAIQAVNETRGVVAYYNGQLASCYYTASNGGQTEKVSHVWGGQDVPYLTYVEDPYDVLNPLSVVKKYTIDKLSPEFSHELLALMMPQISEALEAQGLIADPGLVRVDKVSDLVLQKPLYGDGSQIMTEIEMDVKLSGKKVLAAVLPAATETAPEDIEQEEEFSLFATPSPVVTDAPVNIFVPFAQETTVEPTVEPTIEPTPEPIVYSDYIALVEPVHLTLPLFPDLDNAMGISINGTDNEVITLAETDVSYVLSARRFGHGVGLSQRGAEYMAGKENKTYQEIMTFYYPGIALVKYEDNAPQLEKMNEEQLSTPPPKATPTPKPTLMPTTAELPQGAWYAIVTEIADDSSLNLRQEPNTASDVVMRLYKNQRLIVLERCVEEGFVKVKTDVIEGYVMESFLTKEQ